MILIIAGENDPQAARVGREVRARRGDVVYLNAPDFPERTRVSVRYDEVRAGNRVVALPGAIYVRALGWHPLSPGFAAELKARPHGLVAQCDEKRALLESLLISWQRSGVPVVNPPEVDAQHSRKPAQLQMLAAAGLPVPRWVATNDPKAVRRFVREARRVVYKPLAGGAHVRELTRADMTAERLSGLDLAPVLFQELVSGTPVRVYVVGRRVVGAVAIHSDAIDYRGRETAVEPVRLTRDERRGSLAAARACGMAFTGVDLIRTAAGFCILECNPSPMFAGIEQITGMDVAGPLADFLLSCRARPPQK